MKDEPKFKVTCIFCGSSGPAAGTNDDAWMSWNGNGKTAPVMFGAAGDVF